MFADDIVAVFPSQIAVNQAVHLGLQRYENMFQVEFNFGPTKTAVLPMFGAASDQISTVLCSDYKLLGVQFDEFLDFTKRSSHVLRVGKCCFMNCSMLPLMPTFLHLLWLKQLCKG